MTSKQLNMKNNELDFSFSFASQQNSSLDASSILESIRPYPKGLPEIQHCMDNNAVKPLL